MLLLWWTDPVGIRDKLVLFCCCLNNLWINSRYSLLKCEALGVSEFSSEIVELPLPPFLLTNFTSSNLPSLQLGNWLSSGFPCNPSISLLYVQSYGSDYTVVCLFFASYCWTNIDSRSFIGWIWLSHHHLLSVFFTSHFGKGFPKAG